MARLVVQLVTRGSHVIHAAGPVNGRPELFVLACSNHKFAQGGRPRQPGEEPTCRSCIKALREAGAIWKEPT